MVTRRVPPYNKWVERTSLGRPAFRLRESHAGDPPHPSLRAGRSGLVRRSPMRYNGLIEELKTDECQKKRERYYLNG